MNDDCATFWVEVRDASPSFHWNGSWVVSHIGLESWLVYYKPVE